MTEEQIKNRELSLTVIVPQYNETEEVIAPLLHSIAFQASVSFKNIKVIIVNDHSDTLLSDEFIKSFTTLNISYIRADENRGPGQARQLGVDHTETEYLMFADADDRLFSCNLFKEIFDTLVKNQDKTIDIIYTKWIEELKTETGIMHIPHASDMTWVHGKTFRTAFLNERMLRFNDRIRVHEDSYFNTIVQMNAGVTANIDMYSYFWCFNPNSLTRNTKYKYNYLVETADDLVISVNDTMEQLEKRKTPKRNEYIIKGVFFMYFLLQADYWNNGLDTDEDLKTRRRRYEYGIYKTIKKYQNYFNEEPRANIIKFKNDERTQCGINTGFETEVETWEQFIARLNREYPAYTHTCRDCGLANIVDGQNICPHAAECTMNLDQVYGIYGTPKYWTDHVEKPEEPKKKKTKKEQE